MLLAGLTVAVNNRNLGMVVPGGSRLHNKCRKLQAEKWDIDLTLQVEVWTGRKIDGAPQNQADLRAPGLPGIPTGRGSGHVYLTCMSQ